MCFFQVIEVADSKKNRNENEKSQDKEVVNLFSVFNIKFY